MIAHYNNLGESINETVNKRMEGLEKEKVRKKKEKHFNHINQALVG